MFGVVLRRFFHSWILSFVISEAWICSCVLAHRRQLVHVSSGSSTVDSLACFWLTCRRADSWVRLGVVALVRGFVSCRFADIYNCPCVGASRGQCFRVLFFDPFLRACLMRCIVRSLLRLVFESWCIGGTASILVHCCS